MRETFSVIGKPTPLVDAAEKTTGQGKYTDDFSLPGMLIGKILHSPYPHARIKRIDASRALALEGVVTVVTGEDAPNTYGILPVGHDESCLAVGKVRYVGDNVACVAAVDEATAERALDLIDVEYEPLPAWFDPEESMKAESDFIHEQRPHNIEREFTRAFGDTDQGFAEADYVGEKRYVANEVTHAAIEPHSTLASFEINPHTGKFGRLTVWSSTQVPYYLHHKLSLVLEMPMSEIRVIKPLLGGGFGGKSEICPLEIAAAVAARKARRPVKITYTRQEVFWTHRGRPRTIIDMKVGVKKDGAITACAAKVIQDGGAYCSYGVVTLLQAGALLGALYDVPNIRYEGYRVLTNKPACGAMRGHGTVNIRFAFESQLDEIANHLGIDTAEIRQRNLLKPPCITVNGLRVQSYGLPECIDRTMQASGWRERKGKLPRGRGLGIGCSHFLSGSANPIIRSNLPHSTVTIKLDRDGRVIVFTGAPDIGQGSDTMVAQVAAEVLGCELSRVQVIAADTALTPVDLGAYSSRVTMMNGTATMRAAEEIKAKLVSAAAKHMNCTPEQVVIRHEVVYREGAEPSRDEVQLALAKQSNARVEGQILFDPIQQWGRQQSPQDWMTFDGAVVAAIEMHRTLTATGSYTTPASALGGKFKGAGAGPSPAYGYSAQIADVSVDEETGEVTVNKIWAAHDCGRALNPVQVKGQLIGGVWMGMGQALYEEMIWKDGLLMNGNLRDYGVPSAADSPEIEAIIVESIDPEGPFGAKETSEGCVAAVISAIAGAIEEAVGVRLREAPFTPERVLAAIQARQGKRNTKLTDGVDPTAPAHFREHGGILRYDRNGPSRLTLDPACAADAVSTVAARGDE